MADEASKNPVSLKQAGVLLGLSRATLYREMSAGNLRWENNRRGQRMIRLEELELYRKDRRE